MSLKQALDDCLIDFDRRVLVTDLLEEYKLSYKEVSDTLEDFIKKQEENKNNLSIKYEKRFLVHGMQKEEPGTELYTVVQENKLKDWLQKLRNAESKLYSVEVAGGSKSLTAVFKPMQHLEVKLEKVERRATNHTVPALVTNGVHKATPSATNGFHKPATESDTKVNKEEKVDKSEKPSNSSKNNADSELKKESPKEASAKSKKGSINSFFAAAPPAGNKSKETKAPAVKSASGTMDNFFKKQPSAAAPAASTTKPAPKKESPIAKDVKKESPANTSVALFNEDSAESSDEDEKLDKMRRQVVGSGDEADADDKPSVSKRRRIVDSDDEEQPTKKSNEAKSTAAPEDEIMEVEDDEPTNETYLDEDGFVITQRKPNKNKSQSTTKKKASPPSKPAAAAPAAKKKSPPSAVKKKSPPSAVKNGTTKDASKTKQGNIMSFFNKK